MTARTRLTSLLAAVALAAVPLAGCGGDDDENGGGGGETQATEQSPQQVVDSGDPAKGKDLFAQNCATCHGTDGSGGSGPKLAGEQAYTNPDVVVEQVRNGGGGMPAFGDQLSEQELADVTSYVVKDLAP